MPSGLLFLYVHVTLHSLTLLWNLIARNDDTVVLNMNSSGIASVTRNSERKHEMEARPVVLL